CPCSRAKIMRLRGDHDSQIRGTALRQFLTGTKSPISRCRCLHQSSPFCLLAVQGPGFGRYLAMPYPSNSFLWWVTDPPTSRPCYACGIQCSPRPSLLQDRISIPLPAGRPKKPAPSRRLSSSRRDATPLLPSPQRRRLPPPATRRPSCWHLRPITSFRTSRPFTPRAVPGERSPTPVAS